ncbi:RNA-binding S4 domain-containing protein [Mycoplasmopsis bovis]|uniref:RNA-binding S4 domain-containing protein n=1 Tax=Mycoplasmopsis bovis TaxID=28903 RepID=UPI003D281E8B
MKPEIYIKDDSITIGQLLKKIGLIQTGGGAKFYLEDYWIQIFQWLFYVLCLKLLC